MAVLQSLVLFVFIICNSADAIWQQTRLRRDVEVSYLPHLQLDDAVAVLLKTTADVDICSDPVEVPGGLRIGNIRTPTLSVCENGVILTDSTLLKSFLCVCRGEFGQCEDPGESLYLIAPLWSDVDNISATEDTSIMYQIFEESNASHTGLLEQVWGYINGLVTESIKFFPTWMMVAHWSNVHPYIRPNVIDPRTNTFQAIVATDGTQTYTIFTYNCTDLGWARTNSFLAADCSFIGAYAGGDFNSYQPETDVYNLQIDSRTANISRASCSSEETSWNNFMFILTTDRIVNVTAAEQQVDAAIGDSVAMQFSISTFVLSSEIELDFWFTPQCRCGGPTMPYTFTCNGTEHDITMEGVEIMISCSKARVTVSVTDLNEKAFGDYVVSISVSETLNDLASTTLTLIEEAISQELVENTADPSALSAQDIASASTDLESLGDSALSNPTVRQNYLETIDNLMQADGDSLVDSQADNQSTTRILNSLLDFTSQVELSENSTNETFIFESYGFQLFDISQNFVDQTVSAELGPVETAKNLIIPVNISFSDEADEDSTVYVQVQDTGSDASAYRLSVVVYRQENLFQNSTNSSGVNISSVVITVDGSGNAPSLVVGFQTNGTGNSTMEVCSNFNPGGNGGRGSWSSDSCKKVPCSDRDTGHTCCECHTFGHFGLLLAVVPPTLDPSLETVLVVFSYLGAAVSILSLIGLLITYILAKKLRTSTSGKLLINLGISLLGIYIFFIVSGHIQPYGDSEAVDIICGVSSALLQYFMLVYFSWTAAEALNLYFSLVKVFEARAITSYTLKAGLIAWIVPLAVVIISAGAGSKYYINDVYCRPVEWPFYFAFILPIAVILLFDCAMFVRIMITLYQHTKQTARLKNNEKETETLKRIKQNLRYAVVLVTLFGIGWIFGLVVTGYPDAPMAVTFTLQFIFCLFVSTQGFLLFFFQVALSREARDFWLSQLGKCFPSVKAYRVSRKKVPAKKKKTVKIVKKLTGIFRAPKLVAEETTQLAEPVSTSTMERGQHLESGITESFEASYQTSTLPRSGVGALTPTSPTSEMSFDDLTSVMTSGTFIYSPIDFDQLSLQDEI